MHHVLTLRQLDYEDFMEVLVDDQNFGFVLDEAIGVAAPGQKYGDDSLPWHLVNRGRPKTAFDQSVLDKGTEDAIVFVCGCGHIMCSCVSVRVTVDRDRLIWDRFQGHRICLTGYGPIIFDRAQFACEVQGFSARMLTA